MHEKFTRKELTSEGSLKVRRGVDSLEETA